jgi:hypothetical protein
LNSRWLEIFFDAELKSMEFRDTEDGWYLKFEEGRLTYIHIDFRLGLDVTDESSMVSLTIETPCHLKALNVDVLLTPEITSSVAPILDFFNTEVIGIAIKKLGMLNWNFKMGICLRSTRTKNMKLGRLIV